MKLSLYADYSCRVVMYLSYRRDELAQVRDIADTYNISHDHLRKIVHNLSTHGVLETTKGKSGGVKLAKSPSKILVGDFLRLVESTEDFVECMQKENNKCIITKPCQLKSALNGALDDFFHHLNQYTFEDFLSGNKQLERLLGKKSSR